MAANFGHEAVSAWLLLATSTQQDRLSTSQAVTESHRVAVIMAATVDLAVEFT